MRASPNGARVVAAPPPATLKPCFDWFDMIIFAAAHRANELRSFEILE
jgi:hypothetical protein